MRVAIRNLIHGACTGASHWRLFAIILLAVLSASPAIASSDTAWKAFAAEVKIACLDATKGSIENATAVVDPFGSASFGLAIVSGETAQGRAVAIVCVFDKQSKAVQVGGELDVTVQPNS
jgi:hypothetical protein